MKKVVAILLLVFIAMNLIGCKTISDLDAINFVKVSLIDEFDNKVAETRKLNFPSYFEYENKTVFLTYESQNELLIDNTGLIYPEGGKCNVIVELQIGELTDSVTLRIGVPLANNFNKTSPSNDTSYNVYVELTEINFYWTSSNTQYISSLHFKIYNNSTEVIKCMSKIDGSIYNSAGVRLLDVYAEHLHTGSIIGHSIYPFMWTGLLDMNPNESKNLELYGDTYISNWNENLLLDDEYHFTGTWSWYYY